MRQPESGAQETRWRVSIALITAWLCPATLAQRTPHASLRQCWLIHFVAALLTTLAVLVLIAWSEAGGGFDLAALGTELMAVAREISREAVRHPGEFALAVAGTIVGVEAAFLLLALALMPWGARDEPLRATFRNALRQVWLQTPQILVIVLAFGTAAVTFVRLERLDRTQRPRLTRQPTPPRVPALAPDDPGYQEAMDEFDAAMDQYDEQLAQWNQTLATWNRARPWFIERGDDLLVVFAFALLLWLLWGLLRSVGAARKVIPILRPPMCEACGYNLTTMAMESRCPECGVPVAASLGPDARTGTVWQQRERAGRLSTWWRCAVDAIVRPTELGRRIPATETQTDHRRFLALHLPLVFVVAVTSFATCFCVAESAEEFWENIDIFAIVMTVFGILCMGGMVVFTLLGTGAIGVFESLRYKRNLLPVTIRLACYLSPYLTLWAVFGGASGALLFQLEDAQVFGRLQDLTRIDRETLAVFFWLMPNLVWCGWYFVLVYRGTVGAAYANR